MPLSASLARPTQAQPIGLPDAPDPSRALAPQATGGAGRGGDCSMTKGLFINNKRLRRHCTDIPPAHDHADRRSRRPRRKLGQGHCETQERTRFAGSTCQEIRSRPGDRPEKLVPLDRGEAGRWRRGWCRAEYSASSLRRFALQNKRFSGSAARPSSSSIDARR